MNARLRRYRGEGSRSERGAALIEFAIVALFLSLLSAGAFDYGMAWRVGLVTNEAARTASRTGSALGNNPLADWYALSGARAALQNSGRLQDVERVVVYQSTTADGEAPGNCKTGSSTSAKCNIFSGNQFRNMTQASFNTTTGCYVGSAVKNWCPSSRNNVQLTADYYGVWIQTRYTNQFKLLGDGTSVERSAVMRLEPEVS